MTRSSPASDPVCERAACAPAAVRPAFSATTGRSRARAAAASDASRGASLMPSR